MKRTIVSLFGLGLTVSMASLASCTAAPTTGAGLTALGPGPGSASRFGSTSPLGAGDALGTIIFAGGDRYRPDDFDDGSRYATVVDGDRP